MGQWKKGHLSETFLPSNADQSFFKKLICKNVADCFMNCYFILDHSICCSFGSRSISLP
jgi:hypothetical protein